MPRHIIKQQILEHKITNCTHKVALQHMEVPEYKVGVVMTFRERIFAYENETDVKQLTEKDGNNRAPRKNFSYKKQHTI